jgi:hypothetical protein
MPRRKWSDISPAARRLVLVAGGIEMVMKVLALVDLKRRPASGVNGSKRKWAVALVFLNSVGLVPLVYFRRGRIGQLS